MNLLKDSALYLLGELIAKALPFLLLPYLTRKLGATGFGELSYFQTLCSLLIIVFGLSQDGAITRYFYVYGARLLPRIIQAGLLYTVLCSTIALIWAWATQSLILAAVIGAAATQTILGSQLALRQCQKRASAYMVIQIGAGISVSLLTIALLEWSTAHPVAWRFVALIAGNGMVALLAYFMFIRHPQTAPKKFSGSLNTWRAAFGYILAFGTPLLLHHLSGFAKGQLDRILIYQIFSAEQLGVYAAGFQLASILGILLLALNKATVPYFYQALKQGSLNAATIRRYARLSLLIAPLPALTALMLPENLFLWFLGTQYGGVKYFAIIFLLGYGFTIPYYLLVNFLFYQGKNKQIALISALSTLIYLATLFAAALSGHIAWIAWAMVAGNVAILPLLYASVRDKH